MADIKTRDTVKGTIKTLDKATVAGQKMKQAYIATKEKAERSVNANENTAEEYAADKVQSGIDEISHDAVYSVKVNTNADNPMEVATVDDTKKQLLSDIFWEMNSISSRTETKSHTEIEESDDGHGNIVETETTVTETFLYITVSHKTVDEMATAYGFNEEQKDYLAELLKDENNQLWSQVLYGIGYSDDQIVSVALLQVGNVGGQPYWSWYGFDSRVEWCACFVSWCANECGYIEAGVIPKYAGCVNGAQWFKDRGQWADRNYEPAPGTIIFFDWEGDGETDHTGIVQKCESGIVYTVEGNSGDACRQRQYAVGSSSIYGYGIPAY